MTSLPVDLATPAQQQIAIPSVVVPQPVPTSISLKQAPMPDGSMLVLMSVMTPTGVGVYYLDAATARQVGAQLQKLGSAGNVLIAAGVTGAS